MANKYKGCPVQTITLCGVPIEGFYNPDTNTFGVTVRQAHRLLTEGLPTDQLGGIAIYANNAQKQLKGMLGAGSQYVLLKLDNHSRKQNTLDLGQLAIVIQKASFSGNTRAQELALRMTATSLLDVFQEAFEIEGNRKQRVSFLAALFSSRVARRAFTDKIKEALEETGQDTSDKFVYILLSNAVNEAIFKGGKPARMALMIEGGVPRSQADRKFRENLTDRELNFIEQMEDMACQEIRRRGVEGALRFLKDRKK